MKIDAGIVFCTCTPYAVEIKGRAAGSVILLSVYHYQLLGLRCLICGFLARLCFQRPARTEKRLTVILFLPLSRAEQFDPCKSSTELQSDEVVKELKGLAT